MSDEKFLLEYEKLLDKGYCDCNEMNCIDNNSPRRILIIVKSLQQENKELKKQLEKKYEKLGTLTAEILYEENTRLVNEITVLKTENQKLKENNQSMQEEMARTWAKLQQKEDIINKANNFIKEYEKNRNCFKWNEEDYIDVINEIKQILDNKGE